MIRLAPYIGAAVIAAYLSWSATDYNLKKEIARINAEHQEQILIVVEANAQELARAYDKLDRQVSKTKAIDDKYTKELSRAKTETSNLRDAVDDSNKRLRIAIKANNNTSCPQVPDTNSPSVDTGAGAELDDEARRAYFNLRGGIDSAEIKLKACQELLAALMDE